MNKIDNFDKIAKLLDFKDIDDFYFVQLIKRRKDNPDMIGDSSVQREWFIESVDYLLSKKDEMIELANKTNSRLTIRLNKRNYRDLSTKMLIDISQKIDNENFKGIKSCLSSVAGKFNSDTNKKWIIDCDDKDLKNLHEIRRIINRSMPNIDKIIEELNSKTGIHLITKPFDTRELNSLFKDIEIKKDNPTNLYINNIIS